MFTNPVRVFRVYFQTDQKPHPTADFELVALPFQDAQNVRAALSRGKVLRGKRLIGWPSPADPLVRLIDFVATVELTKQSVRSVQSCHLMCVFRPSEDVASAAASVK